MDWGGVLHYVGGLVSAGAVLAIYQALTGYHIVNLSLEVKSSRTARSGPSQHDLVVAADLRRGSRLRLRLESLRSRWILAMDNRRSQRLTPILIISDAR